MVDGLNSWCRIFICDQLNIVSFEHFYMPPGSEANAFIALSVFLSGSVYGSVYIPFTSNEWVDIMAPGGHQKWGATIGHNVPLVPANPKNTKESTLHVRMECRVLSHGRPRARELPVAQ